MLLACNVDALSLPLGKLLYPLVPAPLAQQAPEVLEGEKATAASDVYSFGMVRQFTRWLAWHAALRLAVQHTGMVHTTAVCPFHTAGAV